MCQSQDDHHYLKVSRFAAAFLATLMTVGAYVLYLATTKTMMEMSLILLALVGGGISGAFLLGLLTRVGDARSVLFGIGATVIFTAYASLAQAGLVPRFFNPYYTSIFANTLMILVACTAAALLPTQSRDLRNLTIWDRASKSHDSN